MHQPLITLLSAVRGQVKKLELNDGSILYCAWISRDPEEEGEGGRSMNSFALAASFNSSLEYSVTSIAEVCLVSLLLLSKVHS